MSPPGRPDDVPAAGAPARPPAADDRPSLLLLPGLLCDDAVWAPVLAPLRTPVRATVAAYGQADTLAAMAREALDQAPPGPLAVAGHSMGGRVALELLRLAPARVQRLALLDTGTHPLPDGDAGARERAGRLELLALARHEGMRTMARRWALGMVHPARHGDAVFDDVLDMLARRSPAVFEAQIRALLARPDAAPLLPSIEVPTLLLCGADDGWSPPTQHAAMQRAIAGSELVVVEHCGHMSTMERPAAVADAFDRWMHSPLGR